MADEVVRVTINPDGTVSMQVEGVPGMDCLAETEDLLRLLGGEVAAQELTAEAYVDAEQAGEERLWH